MSHIDSHDENDYDHHRSHHQINHDKRRNLHRHHGKVGDHHHERRHPTENDDNHNHHHHHHHHQHDRQQQKGHLPKNLVQPLHKGTQTSTHHFVSVCASIPHPDKLSGHGEDSSLQTSRALGVYDGVGAWMTEENVDAGKYSKNLARLTEKRVVRDSKRRVSDAVKSAISENNLPGSCTVCVADVDGRRLRGINIGDSGLVIIRRGEQVYSTHDQSHHFNCPYQVSHKNRADFFEAEEIDFKLEERDILIFATDGLWDNVYKKDILYTVNRHIDRWSKSGFKRNASRSELKATNKFDGKILESRIIQDTLKEGREGIADNVKDLALDLASKACTASQNRKGTSPFARKARRRNEKYDGGKVDDITIIVGMAISSPNWYQEFIEAKCPSCKK